MRSAQVLNVEIEPKGALELARRSRGTPRLANRLLKRVRDFAQVKYDGKITAEIAEFALDLLEVDRYGLDQTDRRILTTMIEKLQAVLWASDTLAAAIGEDAGTIEDVYEPYLIKRGFINRTSAGTSGHRAGLSSLFPGRQPFCQTVTEGISELCMSAGHGIILLSMIWHRSGEMRGK